MDKEEVMSNLKYKTLDADEPAGQTESAGYEIKSVGQRPMPFLVKNDLARFGDSSRPGRSDMSGILDYLLGRGSMPA